MAGVRLVSWKPDLARERVRALAAAGLAVDASPFNPSGMIGHLRETAPLAVVIDLDRLPSHGLGVAVAMRSSRSTRHIPIVFAGGLAEKVARIRRELPDAFYAEWNAAARALKKALRHAPAAPVQPMPHMQRYAGRGLTRKLGFKPRMQAALLGAPEGFAEKLADLPDGVELETRLTRGTAMALWFVRSRRELAGEIEYLGARLPPACALWIVHPKQSSRFKVDFNQNHVRAVALAAGWVDYKVCAVDEDWSGLKFARKKS